jgi:protein-arginine kinase activator protein McsA
MASKSKLELNSDLIKLKPHLKWVRCGKCKQLFKTLIQKDFVFCKNCVKNEKVVWSHADKLNGAKK